MRIKIQADDCDQTAISAEVVSAQLAFVTFKTESSRYPSKEAVTLTGDDARELAKALLSAADAIDFMKINEFALP
jgi:hypothetical protein